MSAEELERGYWRAYRDFYRWGSIARGAASHADLVSGARHFVYAAGWKKFEPLWDVVIRAKRAGMMLPVLETILSEFGRRSADQPAPGRTKVCGGMRAELDADASTTALAEAQESRTEDTCSLKRCTACATVPLARSC
jgi:hypothetical protein